MQDAAPPPSRRRLWLAWYAQEYGSERNILLRSGVMEPTGSRAKEDAAQPTEGCGQLLGNQQPADAEGGVQPAPPPASRPRGGHPEHPPF
eukprot:SAG22_NODE_9966_length_560_cov_3.060738_1_plen_89_part_10